MKATINWTGDVKFDATSGSGHTVKVDGPPDHGGENAGVRPMELMLLGVGSCASFDVVHILKKARQPVSGCRAEVSAERVDEVPAVFKSIHLHFVVSGAGLKENQVKRAVSLSADKYCSASIMMSKAGVTVTHSYELESLDQTPDA